MNNSSVFINRELKKTIENNLFKGKTIIVYGARQVGKTTLCKEILKKYPEDSQYINCELMQNRQALGTANDKKLKDFLGNKKLTVLDEAQKVKDIGTALKIIADTFPDMQIIATGSSSFELANKTAEAMTGRARRYFLYPLSVSEIAQSANAADLDAKLENMLRFGIYPGVYGRPEKEAAEELSEIASNYLYKDIFEFSGIRQPELLSDLLTAIALQLGNEVSLHELANLLGKNSHTIEAYLRLLEQAFIIFKLRSFSRNLRKEIGKKYKIYFYDLGVRNSLIRNFNPLTIRNDIGALWENFCIAEKMKANSYARVFANYYFWRTYDQKEIDFIEERDGRLYAYEFKWQKSAGKAPREFLETYPNSEFKAVNRGNYREFLK